MKTVKKVLECILALLMFLRRRRDAKRDEQDADD